MVNFPLQAEECCAVSETVVGTKHLPIGKKRRQDYIYIWSKLKQGLSGPKIERSAQEPMGVDRSCANYPMIRV
jgi:hypothetical protein